MSDFRNMIVQTRRLFRRMYKRTDYSDADIYRWLNEAERYAGIDPKRLWSAEEWFGDDRPNKAKR